MTKGADPKETKRSYRSIGFYEMMTAGKFRTAIVNLLLLFNLCQLAHKILTRGW
jgi:hypothetical protein